MLGARPSLGLRKPGCAGPEPITYRKRTTPTRGGGGGSHSAAFPLSGESGEFVVKEVMLSARFDRPLFAVLPVRKLHSSEEHVVAGGAHPPNTLQSVSPKSTDSEREKNANTHSEHSERPWVGGWGWAGPGLARCGWHSGMGEGPLRVTPNLKEECVSRDFGRVRQVVAAQHNFALDGSVGVEVVLCEAMSD